MSESYDQRSAGKWCSQDAIGQADHPTASAEQKQVKESTKSMTQRKLKSAIDHKVSWFVSLAREANRRVIDRDYKDLDWHRGYYKGRRRAYISAARSFRALLEELI